MRLAISSTLKQCVNALNLPHYLDKMLDFSCLSPFSQVRLLTFVKGVPMLRGIITGLLAGLKSVMYIVLLLFLIMYLFGIMGCLLFGVNDTARFGTVTKAMLSLFQVVITSFILDQGVLLTRFAQEKRSFLTINFSLLFYSSLPLFF